MRDNTAKIFCIVGIKETGKTDYVKNLMKAALAKRPTDRGLIIDRFDNPPWRTYETYNDPNTTPINIIKNQEIAHWGINGFLAENRIMRTADSNIQETFELASKYFFNGILVIEDATKVIRSGKLTDAQAQMIYDCKQKSVDTIFLFHYFKKIPEELAGMTDFLIIGKNKEDFKEVKNRFPDEAVKEAMQKANESKDQYIKIPVNVGI